MKKRCWILIMLIPLISCKKGNELDYPVVFTGEVLNLNDTGLSLHGKVSYFDLSEIEETGFIYGLSVSPDTNSYKIVVDTHDIHSIFSCVHSLEMLPNNTINVRAFAKTKNAIVYGNVVSVYSLNFNIDSGEFVEFYEQGFNPYYHGEADQQFSFSLGETGYIGFNTTDIPGILVAFNPNNTTYKWRIVKDYSDILDNPSYATVLNDTGYIFAGNCFYKFNRSSNSFVPLSSYGGEKRSGSVGFCINGKLYIGSGFVNNNIVNDFWEYDVDLDSWERLRDFPGEGKGWFLSFNVKERIFIGGGIHNSKEFWEYLYMKDQWIKKSNLPVEANSYECAYFTYNNKPYFCFNNILWRYNEFFDHWEQINSLMLTNAFNVSINNQVFIGTYNFSYFPGEIYEYVKIWKYNN